MVGSLIDRLLYREKKTDLRCVFTDHETGIPIEMSPGSLAPFVPII